MPRNTWLNNKITRLRDKILLLMRSIFVCLSLLSIFVSIVPILNKSYALQSYLEYQGRLSDQNGNLLTGNYYVTFCMYASSAPATACTPVASPAAGSVSTLGSALWGETEYFASTNSPDNHVVNGVFAAKLGSASPFPASLFSANSDLYLGVNVYNGSSWDGQMSPLTEITSAAYSLDSGSLVTSGVAYTASQTPSSNQIPILDGSGNLTLPGSISSSTGGITFGGSTNIFSSTPAASTTHGILNIGNGGFSGGANNFNGFSSGTDLAINNASGYTGDIANFQIAGKSVLTIGSTGELNDYGGLYDFSVNGITESGGTFIQTYPGDIFDSPIPNPSVAPTLATTTTGGSLPSGTYYAKYSCSDTEGETLTSPESTITVPSGTSTNAITIKANSSCKSMNTDFYVSNSGSGNETYQGYMSGFEPTYTFTSYTAGRSPVTENTSGGDLTARRVDVTQYGDTNPGLVLNNGLSSATKSPLLSFQVNGTLSRSIQTDSTNNLNILSSTGSILDQIDNNGQIVVNAPSGYSGNLLTLKYNGATMVAVGYNGNIAITATSSYTNDLIDAGLSGGIYNSFAVGYDGLIYQNAPSTNSRGLLSLSYNSSQRLFLDTAGNLYVNGQITANGNNAVHNYTSGPANVSVAAINTYYTTGVSITVTLKNSSDVTIYSSAYIGGSLTSGNANFTIYRNGSNIVPGILYTTPTNYLTVGATFIDKSVAAGTYTYTLYVSTSATTGTIAVQGISLNGIII